MRGANGGDLDAGLWVTRPAAQTIALEIYIEKAGMSWSLWTGRARRGPGGGGGASKCGS